MMRKRVQVQARYLDLTMPLGPDTPVYPGDPRPELVADADFGTHGYLCHTLKLGTHAGTHLDAPGHMVPGAALLGDFGVERFFGRGVLIDMRDGLDAERVRGCEIQPGDIVLLWTGFSDDLSATYYERVPDIAPAATALLAASGASLVGIDAGSIDTEPFPVHKAILGADILLAENLIGLARLAGQAFTVTALPLRLGLDGAPARVVATIAAPGAELAP